MPRTRFILFVLVWIGWISFGQDLKYISGFEKETIDAIKRDGLSNHFVSALIMVDSTSTNSDVQIINERIDQCVSVIKSSKNFQKKRKKKLQFVYDTVHDMFLRKYELKSYFPEVFDDGIYNCVSASALYAIIFDRLEIPYVVKEAPSHVYLMAYPEKENIYVETTVPGSMGLIAPDEKELKKLGEYLVKMKIITAEELKEEGVKKVYNDFYYGNSNHDKEALVGMQYFNKAVFHFNDGALKEAHYNMEKACLYYKEPKGEILKESFLMDYLREASFETKEDLGYLLLWFKGLSYASKDKAILDYPIYKVVENCDLPMIETFLEDVELLENEALKKDVKFQFYQLIARGKAEEGEVVVGRKYAEKAYAINDQFKPLKRVITYCVIKELQNEPIDEALLDKIKQYQSSYPYLKGKTAIISIEVMTLSKLVYDLFSASKRKKGEQYLKTLEQLIAGNDGLMLNKQGMANTYFKVGKYYYRNDLNLKAKKYFEKGLNYAPNDKELRKFLNWVKEDL